MKIGKNMNTRRKIKNLGLIVIAAIFTMISQNAAAQDILAGDNLDFSFGYNGWTARVGAYNGGTNNPNWGCLTATALANPTQAQGGITFFEIITDATVTDTRTNNNLLKVPTMFGCTQSSRINKLNEGGQCSQLQYTFEVSPDNSLLTIYYAMVLETPHPGEHYANPTFQIDVMSNASTPPYAMTNDLVDACAFFEQSGDISLNALPTGWHGGQSGWAYCDWQQVKINLKRFEGDRVTLRIRISGCAYSAHAGYGYVAAKAEPAKIDVPGCAGNGDTVTIAQAPEGFQEYKWFEIESTFLSQDQLAAIDATAPALSTSQELVVTNAMMGNDNVKFYAVKIKAAPMYPTWGTQRPSCEAYITTQVNDIRPIFNLSVTEPGPDDPAGRTVFAVNDVTEAAAPIYWQKYDFGDGTAPIELQLNGMIWEVINEADNPSTTYVRNANNSVEQVIHTYAQDGTYSYTRTVRSSEDPLAETVIFCEKSETQEVVIPKVPSLVLTAVEDICFGETASITATSPDEQGTGADADFIYQWWHSREAIDNEAPLFERATYEETLTQTTTFFCKVTDQTSGYYRIDSIIINVQDFPEVTLEGATKLCMGDVAVLSASDATGAAEAFQWTFTRPSNPPVMNNPSANAVLEFTPTKDTTVYLMARTSAGCIAYDSVLITVINPQAFVDKKEICPGESVVLRGENAVEYTWTANPPDATLTTERVTEAVTASPEVTTVYTMSGYGETGCHTDRQVTVTVFPYPVATIATTPSYVDVDNPVLSITDVSPNSASSSWIFSDGGTSEARSLAYSFNDLSVDSVSIHLTSYNKLGCWDSTSIRVPIELFAVWMPNAFSPNGDGINDRIFFASQNNLEDVRLDIFNRQGTRLYEFTEASMNCSTLGDMTETLGWDGTYNGEICPQGTYVYRLSYRRTGSTRVFDRSGTITIVR